MKIKQAVTKVDIREVRLLFREYENFLNVDLSFQGFEHEVANLPGEYASPDGVLFVGIKGGKIVACAAVRKLNEEVCEMKRLFVRPEARGSGGGKKLAQECIAFARRLKYSTIRLDTLENLNEAIILYENLGFYRIAPYYYNPLPEVIFWELKLNN